MKKNVLESPNKGLSKFLYFIVFTLITSLTFYSCRKQELIDPDSKIRIADLPESEEISPKDIGKWAENLDFDINFNLQWSKSKQAVIDGKHVVKIPVSNTSAMILSKDKQSGVLSAYAIAWKPQKSKASGLNAEFIWFDFQDLEMRGQKIKNGMASQILTFKIDERADSYLTNPDGKLGGDRVSTVIKGKEKKINLRLAALSCFMNYGYYNSSCEQFWSLGFNLGALNDHYGSEESFWANYVIEDEDYVPGGGGGGGGGGSDQYNWGVYTQHLYSMLYITPDDAQWLDHNQTMVDHYFNYVLFSSELSLEERKTYAAKSISKMAIDPAYYAFAENYRIGLINSGRGEAHAWWSDEEWLGNGNNFSLSFEPDVYKNLTAAEKTLVKIFPLEAYSIYKNRSKAEKETIRRFGVNGLNDKSDAFRHAFFNSLNERDCGHDHISGESIAKRFSDAHESETPLAFALEKQMDLFNNAVGHTVGYSLFPLFTGLSDSESSSEVFQKLIEGQLRYLSPLDFTNYNHGIIPNITILTPTNL